MLLVALLLVAGIAGYNSKGLAGAAAASSDSGYPREVELYCNVTGESHSYLFSRDTSHACCKSCGCTTTCHHGALPLGGGAGMRPEIKEGLGLRYLQQLHTPADMPSFPPCPLLAGPCRRCSTQHMQSDSCRSTGFSKKMVCWVDAPERNATWQVRATSSSTTCITTMAYSSLPPASSVAAKPSLPCNSSSVCD